MRQAEDHSGISETTSDGIQVIYHPVFAYVVLLSVWHPCQGDPIDL